MWFAEADDSRLCKLEAQLEQEVPAAAHSIQAHRHSPQIFDIRNFPAPRPIGVTNDHEDDTEDVEDDDQFASSEEEFEAEVSSNDASWLLVIKRCFAGSRGITPESW